MLDRELVCDVCGDALGVYELCHVVLDDGSEMCTSLLRLRESAHESGGALTFERIVHAQCDPAAGPR